MYFKIEPENLKKIYSHLIKKKYHIGSIAQNWLILQKFRKNQKYKASRSKIIK